MTKPLCELTHLEALAALRDAEIEVARLRDKMGDLVCCCGPIVTWFGSTLVEYAKEHDFLSIANGVVLLAAPPSAPQDAVTSGQMRTMLAAVSAALAEIS